MAITKDGVVYRKMRQRVHRNLQWERVDLPDASKTFLILSGQLKPWASERMNDYKLEEFCSWVGCNCFGRGYTSLSRFHYNTPCPKPKTLYFMRVKPTTFATVKRARKAKRKVITP